MNDIRDKLIKGERVHSVKTVEKWKIEISQVYASIGLLIMDKDPVKVMLKM